MVAIRSILYITFRGLEYVTYLLRNLQHVLFSSIEATITY